MPKESIYYFIYYSMHPLRTHDIRHSGVISLHPFDWMIKQNSIHTFETKLISFQQVTEEEALMWNNVLMEKEKEKEKQDKKSKSVILGNSLKLVSNSEIEKAKI